MSDEATILNQAAGAAQSAGGLGTLGINLKIFLAQLVNFLLVLFVLRKWAYGPLVKILDQRKETIAKSLKEAKEIEDRLAALSQERQEVMNQAKAQAALFLEQAKAQASKRQSESLKAAKIQVAGIIEDGKKQLQAEKSQMIIQARDDMAQIAIMAAEKIIKDSIDEKRALKLAAETIATMK